MTTVTVELPDKVLKALKEKIEREGKSLEEVIGEATLKQCSIEDPEVKAEFHLKLCEKYLREGDDLLAKSDYVQASEKFWGAASQAVKALAAERGMELRSHGELHVFVARLGEEAGEPEIRRLWQSAGMLHQNFYENWLPPRMVKENAEDVKTLADKLRELTK